MKSSRFFSLPVFLFSFFSASANGLINDRDSLAAPPKDSSLVMHLKNNRHKLMGVTQQVLKQNEPWLDYIQNQNTSAQDGNFWIGGNGIINGRLSIGVANSGFPFHVKRNNSEFTFNEGLSNLTPSIAVNVDNYRSTALVSGTQGSAIVFDDAGMFSISKEPKANFLNGTLGNGTNLFTLLANGNVGIGLSNPTVNLEIQGNSNSAAIPVGVLVKNTNASGKANFSAYNDIGKGVGLGVFGSSFGAGLPNAACIGTNNTSMVLMTDGEILNGGNSPISFRVGGYDPGTEKMRIAASGNVGIATTNPEYKLDVNGSARFGSITIAGNNPASYSGNGFYMNKASWDGSTSYPTLGSTSSVSLVMFENPHIVYRTDAPRPGASGKSGIRMAVNATGQTWWDAGLKDGDEYEIYRWNSGNNTGNQFLSINSSGQFTIPNLSDGSGVPKMVVSTNGVLGYQNIPGGGSSITANNGLSATANNVVLGGMLNQNTSIYSGAGGDNPQHDFGIYSRQTADAWQYNYFKASGGQFIIGNLGINYNSNKPLLKINGYDESYPYVFRTNDGIDVDARSEPWGRDGYAGRFAYSVATSAQAGNSNRSHYGIIATAHFTGDGSGYNAYAGYFKAVNSAAGTSNNAWGVYVDAGNVFIRDIANASINTGKFLVSDDGVLKYRTAAEMVADLGVASGGGTASLPSTQIAYGSTGNLITSNSNLTFDGNNLLVNGNIGIGTATTNSYKLAVNGSAIFTRVKVRAYDSNWPDYVFERTYKLSSLKEVEAFIKQHKHLPDVPSAEEIKKEGIDVVDNQAVLLKKIEELTLYSIEQNKKIEKLEEQAKSIEELKKEIESLKELIKAK